MPVAETMGPRDFARFLAARGVKMSHQAISKAPYLPKTSDGKVIVVDALAALEQRGRLQSQPDGETAAEDEQKMGGRPRAGGTGGNSYYDELTLTERVKRRKLELEVDEREGKLLPAAGVAEAMVAAGRRIGERIERLTQLADELVKVAKTGEVPEVRAVLRREARALREYLAEAMTIAPSEEDEPA